MLIDKRLVRGVHRGRDEPRGERRLGRVRHVQHVDAALLVEDVRRVEERGVVVRAVVTRRVHVRSTLKPPTVPIVFSFA